MEDVLIYQEVIEMRFPTCLALLALMASSSCKSPEFQSFQQSPPPIAVEVNIWAHGIKSPDVEYMEVKFAEALRARLADFVTVVPDGAEPPLDASLLKIEINHIARGEISPTLAGVAAGAAVGGLTTNARHGRRNTGGIINGIFWGLLVAQDIDARQRQHTLSKFGYIPPRIKGYISLSHSNSAKSKDSKTIYTASVPTGAVIDEMTPLRGDESHNYASINAVLADAFARAIANRLQDKFKWHTNGTPSWYEPQENRHKKIMGDETEDAEEIQPPIGKP